VRMSSMAAGGLRVRENRPTRGARSRPGARCRRSGPR